MVVCEACDLIRCFICKADLLAAHPTEGAPGITSRLHLHIGDMLAGIAFLSFDNPNRMPADKQGIIDGAGACGEFPDGNAKRSNRIQAVHILNHPAGLRQLPIYRLSCPLFRRHTLPAHRE